MASIKDIYLASKGAVDKATLGDGVVQPSELKQYIKELVADTTFIKEGCEVGTSATEVYLLPRLASDDEFLNAGEAVAKDANGEYITTNYNVNTNKIVCNPYVGAIKLEDSAVDVNVEGEDLANSLISMAAKKSSMNIEKLALYSDTESTNNNYKQTDGFIKNAGVKIYASDLADTKASTIIQGIINGVDEVYRDTENFKIFVDPTTFDAYLDELIARNTDLGDAVLRDGKSTYVLYKGYKVYNTPSLGSTPAGYEDGKVAIGVYTDNATVKYFKELKAVSERKELDFATYMALKTKVGFNYKNENAAVVYYFTKSKN